MGRRKKLEAKLDLEESDGGDMSPHREFEAVGASSSSDEDANADLTLTIIEKSNLMRAKELGPRPFSWDVSDDEGSDASLGDRPQRVDSDKAEAIKVEKKSKDTKMLERQELVMGALEDEEKKEPLGATDNMKSADPNPTEIVENNVLRKLLRGPRYFDPPGNSWGTCYSCGEEGHAAANCSQKRKRPCFVCGSLEHNVKDCSKGLCHNCKGSGHRAKDCPQKKKRSKTEKLCLKCGKYGHDMFQCENDYSSEDLKQIQCYICNSFGHLCCRDYVDNVSSEISCYRCGLLGHTGSACGRKRGENQVEATLNSCYSCGEGGHFARECPTSHKILSNKASTSLREGNQGELTPRSCFNCGQEGHIARECYSTKKEHLNTSSYNQRQGEATWSTCYKCGAEGHFARDCPFPGQLRKRSQELSSPALMFNNGNRDHGGFNTPNNSKFGKRKKSQDTDGSETRPRKAKQRGRLVSEDRGASKARRSVKNNDWVSPAAPPNANGRPHKFQYGDASESGYSASRFRNSGSDSTRRNYNWR